MSMMMVAAAFKISTSGSTPAAPTGGVVDDNADTFSFTLNPLFSLSQHEYSVNGAGYATVTTNPIEVGGLDVPIGDLKVRVKSIGGNPASSPLTNATAFTVPEDNYAPFVSGVVVDDGLYNFGPIPYQLSDGSIVTIFKRAGSHASAGPLMISRSLNGGTSWTETQVNVGGSLLEVAAHSWVVYPDGGQLIAYQDNELYTTVKFAYRAGWTGNFTARSGSTYASSLDGVSICPFRMKFLPEGELRFTYYEWNTAGTQAKGGFLETTDRGVTFTQGPILYDRTTQATASPVSDWMLNEFDWECIDDTGTNSTSRFISIARVAMPAEGGTYYTHFKSTGGETWASDVATEDAGSFVNDLGTTVSGPFSRGLLYRFLSSNSPVCIKLFGSTVYLANGERNPTDGYALKVTTATVEGAFRNKYDDWTAPVIQMAYNATSSGSSIDCGYPEMFTYKETEEGAEMLCYQDYDVSTEPKNPAITDDRCWIYQGEISIP